MFRDPVFVSSLVFVMYFFLLKHSLSYSEFCFLSGNNHPSNRLVSPHKVLTYIEHHSVCPLVGWDSPTPFSRKRVCPPPPPGPKSGGAHSPAAKGVGESQFQRLEKRLALCLLCVSPVLS
jgi:hypothetical protein